MAKEELSPEEQEAADKLKAESKTEKTKIDQIGDDLSGVTEMLKSHVEKTEKAEDDGGGEEEKPIDYSAINPEELAKSLVESDDKEKTVDFISRLTEGCNLMPQDMIAEDGEPFVSAEMMKSLEEASDEGKKFLSGILYSMQEANERNSKIAAVNMQLMSTLTKSIQDQNGILSVMEKSFTAKTVETKTTDAATELPEFTEENSNTAKSVDVADETPALVHRDVGMRAVKKSFISSDPAQYRKQNEYCEKISSVGFETAMNQIPVEDMNIIKANLV